MDGLQLHGAGKVTFVRGGAGGSREPGGAIGPMIPGGAEGGAKAKETRRLAEVE